MKRAVVALATALLVVTAGCAATPGTGTPTAADGGTDGGDGSDATDGGGDDASTDSGTVSFYVSDEPNDMDDFANLNVTIATVEFRLVDAANESADEENATTTATAAPNGTDADGDADGTDVDEEREGGDDEREADEMDGDDDERGDGRWVAREVNATSVDLSELRGANATLLEQFDLPAGEYDKVRMGVSEVDGRLTSGESATVKLPSNRLRLNSRFTVENGSDVDFVYDVSVHKAGNSGKYILKPVVSESGTEVEIQRVGDEREDDGDERSVSASFAGDVAAGGNVTVVVTENGSAVANATVSVDDGPTGTTDADGEYVVSVPDGAEELEVGVESGGAEAELEAELDGDASGNSGPDGGDRGEGAGNGQGN